MTERNIVTQPYSADEQRVAIWLRERIPDIGAGDDPIGFVLASYEHLHLQQQQTKGALAEVMEWINNWDPPMVQDAEWAETARKIKEALRP